MNDLHLRSSSRCFGGYMNYYAHYSSVCDSTMNFALYLPPGYENNRYPVLYYLSGLTCTEDNFTIKAGAQKYAAREGIVLVIPDTSPRNTGIVGEDESWDLGSGASFYVDSIVSPWSAHYQMYSYITGELPRTIAANFAVNIDKQGIFGHSMGGHGALICALNNPDRYLSVSAFAPISHPSATEWGQKALRAYLGDDRSLWLKYDATELVKKQRLKFPILIDQGLEDTFYHQGGLLPEDFARACAENHQPLNLRFHEGYDHGYFFISTFIEDHIMYHAKSLCV